MTTTTSQMSAFEDAVLALIQAQLTSDGNTGVQCAVGPLGNDTHVEYIHSLGGPSLQDWSAIGQGEKREEMQLALKCYASATGGGESQVKEARDRVDVFVATIETALRDGVNLPTVAAVIRVQIDEISAPNRGAAFHNDDDRAEDRTVTISGMAELYVT